MPSENEPGIEIEISEECKFDYMWVHPENYREKSHNQIALGLIHSLFKYVVDASELEIGVFRIDGGAPLRIHDNAQFIDYYSILAPTDKMLSDLEGLVSELGASAPKAILVRSIYSGSRSPFQQYFLIALCGSQNAKDQFLERAMELIGRTSKMMSPCAIIKTPEALTPQACDEAVRQFLRPSPHPEDSYLQRQAMPSRLLDLIHTRQFDWVLPPAQNIENDGIIGGNSRTWPLSGLMGIDRSQDNLDEV